MGRRHAAPFVRDVFARFRRDQISAPEAAAELQISRSRFYALYTLRFYEVSLRYAPTPQAKGRGGGGD